MIGEKEEEKEELGPASGQGQDESGKPDRGKVMPVTSILTLNLNLALPGDGEGGQGGEEVHRGHLRQAGDDEGEATCSSFPITSTSPSQDCVKRLVVALSGHFNVTEEVVDSCSAQRQVLDLEDLQALLERPVEEVVDRLDNLGEKVSCSYICISVPTSESLYCTVLVHVYCSSCTGVLQFLYRCITVLVQVYYSSCTGVL